ncbi:hypothetical protein pb186bvf_004685 [Paramecium bursaria]
MNEFTCLRKHFLKSKIYYIQIQDTKMILSENKNLTNPKYIVHFNFDSRILWKNSENDELSKFGLLYGQKVKWFESDNNTLNSLKYLLANKLFFGNIINFYDSLSILGTGASSKVCLIRRKQDLICFAAKCISKQYISSKKSTDRMQRLKSEISILSTIDYKGFVKLHEIYQGENSYYLVTDHLEGDTLYNYVRNYPSDQIPSVDIRDCMRQILCSLHYLDQRGIIHRDIKLENIMLSRANDIRDIKIIDFGLAIYQSQKHRLSICGTPGYIAPEILRCEDSLDSYFSTHCDVFSAGVIFYKLLTKKTLFKAENTMEIMDLNRKCQINFQDLEYRYQKEAINLLRQMLNPNPLHRPSASECLKHSYFDCKLQDVNLLQDYNHERATAFSYKSRQKDTYSIGQEDGAALVRRSNPTSYIQRQQNRKRTKSPRKYADMSLYLPSFNNNSMDSDVSKSSSRELSKVDGIYVQDEIIEDCQK